MRMIRPNKQQQGASVVAPEGGSPAIGTPAIGTPAIGTPSQDTPAVGTPSVHSDPVEMAAKSGKDRGVNGS